MNPMDDQQPSTSFSTLSNHVTNIDYSSNFLIDFTNLCMNGAKFFEDQNDRQRFIDEFTELQAQNPDWSAIRLIRSRLQLQMQIFSDRQLANCNAGKQKKNGNSNDSKQNHVQNNATEDTNALDPYLLSESVNDQLINNINKQIEDERLIELDETRTVFARSDNFIVIDAGDGQCAIVDCAELLKQNSGNLHRVEDIHLYNPLNDVMEVINKSKSTSNHKQSNSIEKSSTTNRVKHTCPNCSLTFSYLNRYVEHMKEAHFSLVDEKDKKKRTIAEDETNGKRRSQRSSAKKVKYSQDDESDGNNEWQ